MPKMFIYMISNDINDQKYVGKTKNVDDRWKQHKNNSISSTWLFHLPLYSDMRKYGIDKFHIKTLEEVENDCEAERREQYWIQYYDTFQNGYNSTLGGNGSYLYNYEELLKLWNEGKTIKQISSIMNCNDFVVRTMLDKQGVETQERKDRSAYRQEDSHKQYRREVQQKDINTNDVINTYKSVLEAAKTISCDSSHLSKVCRSNGIAYGYRWNYTGNDYVKKDFTAKEVCKIDLNTGEILEIFPSSFAAAKAVNGSNSYISKVCRGIQKSSKGFGWKYLKDCG